jgi:Zn-dependent protease
MTTRHPPGTVPAHDSTDSGRPKRGASIAVRLTVGGYVLAMLTVLVSGIGLPSAAPGWPPVLYVAAAAGIAVALLASLTAHEFAHATAARRHGIPVAEITVGFFGGPTHDRHDLPGPRAQWRVAAAGPAASLILAATAAAAAIGLSALGAGQLIILVLTAVAWLNLVFAGFTLLPGTGPDGGRIIRALAWARTGDPVRAGLAAARTGRVIGALLIAAGVGVAMAGHAVGIGAAMIGFLAIAASHAEFRHWLTATRVPGMRVRDILPPDQPQPGVQAWLTVRAFVESRGAAGEQPGRPATAYPLVDLDGRPAGIVTQSQIGAVPASRRDVVRLRDIAAPVTQMVTTTGDEPLTSVLARLAARPATPAGLLTAGHALVLGADGTLAGLLTPADFARASHIGVLRQRGKI